MLMRGDIVTLEPDSRQVALDMERYGHVAAWRTPVGTVTGVLHGLVIVAWQFGNTTTHKSRELVKP